MECVKQYYDKSSEQEWQRLNKPYTRVEYESTLYLIEQYFPKDGHILDIGSGPGRYALALLERGYSVSLLDLSKNELNIAKRRIESSGFTANAYYCQSALELGNFEDNSFEAILLMGPLYHLHLAEERNHILKEVKRILKPNGTALIAYINTWGVLKASLREFPEFFADEKQFGDYVAGDLKYTEDESFTATYFTTPPLALKEVEAVGFKVVSYAGAESFVAGLNLQMENLATDMPAVYKNYLQKAAEYCELPQYRDATEHLHIIVKK